MLSWSGKSKDTTDHALPTRTNNRTLPVHLVHTPPTVPAPQKKNSCGTVSYSPSPSYDLSVEIVTPKGNSTPCNNPPNPVPNVPADPDSDPSSLGYSLSYSYGSSDNDYSNQIRCTINDKIISGVKVFTITLSKSTQILQP